MSAGHRYVPAVLRLARSALPGRLTATRLHRQVHPTLTSAVRSTRQTGHDTSPGSHAAHRALGVVVAGLVAVSASPALAAQQRVFEGAFGCAEGAPGCTVPDPYPLAANPWSVAVNDTTGDVYVADALNHRVEEFTAKGQFVLMFGKDVNKTKQGGLPSEANVCDPEKELAVECQAGVASSEPGGFESVKRKEGGGTEPAVEMFVAVDNSSGPSAGDVYVGDYVEGGLGLGNRVSKFDASGHLVSTWGEAKNGEIVGAGAKPFGPIAGIAVDASGDLWVAGVAGVMTFEFSQEAEFKTDWVTPLATAGPFGVAVDSQDDLYFVSYTDITEVSSAGAEVGVIAASEPADPLQTYGAAVDPGSGDLFVPDSTNGTGPEVMQLRRFLPGCRPSPGFVGCTAAEAFTNPHLTGTSAGAAGVAVGAGEADPVYVADRVSGEVRFFAVATVPGVLTGKPSALTGTAATLQGSVDPSGVGLVEGVEGCRFEWGLAGRPYEHVVACAQSAAQIGSGTSPVAVSVGVTGLQPGVSYHYRLVAANVNDLQEPALGSDVAFGPPLIESESSVEVGALTASLQAQVDPQSVDTRVRVQYGASTEYGSETGEVDIGAGSTAQSVPVGLEGLAPSSTYHYRFVAENALAEGAGAILGPDRVFSTQGAGSFRLADARGWELVSPRAPHGASIEALTSSYDTGGATQAAADGSAVSYVTNVPVQSDVQGYPEFAQVLSTRGPSGWVSRDLSVPHSASVATTTSVTYGREYRYFSEDLSHAVLQPQGQFEPCTSALGAPEPCLSPQASEQTAFVQDLHTGLFTPLASGCPSPAVEEEGHPCPAAVVEHADVPPGTVFGQASVLAQVGCPPLPFCGSYFQDATPDLSHVVVESRVALSEEPGATKGLYEWSAGRLTFVGEGQLGSPGLSGDRRHAISADGSRVFWTASASTGHLYMRDMASGELLQLDVPEAECVAKGAARSKLGMTRSPHSSSPPATGDACSSPTPSS